jgi:hypothetical protein
VSPAGPAPAMRMRSPGARRRTGRGDFEGCTRLSCLSNSVVARGTAFAATMDAAPVLAGSNVRRKRTQGFHSSWRPLSLPEPRWTTIRRTRPKDVARSAPSRAQLTHSPHSAALRPRLSADGLSSMPENTARRCACRVSPDPTISIAGGPVASPHLGESVRVLSRRRGSQEIAADLY